MYKEAPKKNRSITSSYLWRPFFILCCFGFTEWVLLSHYGIRASWDSTAYWHNAQGVLNGFSISQDYKGYASYIYYLICHLFFDGGPTSVAYNQIMLAGISVLAFYQIALRFLPTLYSFRVSIIFAIWPTLRYWDAYLYTDSLYVSLIIICLYLVLLVKERALAWYWLVPMLLLISFVRPPALIFTMSLLLAFGAHAYSKPSPSRITLLGMYGLLFLTAISCILFWFKTEHAIHLLSSYEKGEVIYPNICISPSHNLQKTSSLLAFILHNPLWILKLGCVKLWYFLSGTKPYYSLLHNSFACFSYGLLYALSILSIWYKCLKKEEVVLALSFFGVNILMVATTAENWDGRFHLPFIPFLLLLAAKGIEELFKHLTNKNTRLG